LIQSSLEGKRLSEVLTLTSQEEWPKLFKAVGETYTRVHSIKGPISGVWAGGPEKTLPILPNDFYFNSEIMAGSGRRAYESDNITRSDYLKIQSIWKEYLPMLKNHVSSLVHGSPFPWTICLRRNERREFEVSRLNALGDFLWWDPAYDFALIKYPPNHEWPGECVDALEEAYGVNTENWRLNLYAILQHLCAINDIYLAPPALERFRISKQAAYLRLKGLLDSF
jgi:hypothetical protein